MKAFFSRSLKKRYVQIGLGIVVLIVIVSIVHGSNKPATFESAAVARGTVVESVTVSGSVSPVDKASLSFEKSGVLAHVYAKVGDHVSAGQAIAEIGSAGDRAALESAQATFDDISRALTPEEAAVQKNALASAEVGARNAASSALVKAQDAVYSYGDAFFTNAQSLSPTVALPTRSAGESSSIDSARLGMTNTFADWSAALNASLSPGDTITKSAAYLSTVENFVNRLSDIVENLSSSSSGLSQTTINTDLATINQGLSELHQAIDSVTAAKNALDAAQSNYALKLAGNSSQSIAASSAKVEEARAALAKDTLTSPIDGVVTKADPGVGEFVSAGSSGFAVEGTGYKIEAFVPESDIAKITVGNLASSTLDAYGQKVDFPAKVIAVDPAETVLEGVPTYKVTLQFITSDSRIRSGMTSNLTIMTHEAQNVLRIPYRAVAITSTSTTVRLVQANGKLFTSVPVETGLKGSDGTIEIVSGLSEGDQIVTYQK